MTTNDGAIQLQFSLEPPTFWLNTRDSEHKTQVHKVSKPVPTTIKLPILGTTEVMIPDNVCTFVRKASISSLYTEKMKATD